MKVLLLFTELYASTGGIQLYSQSICSVLNEESYEYLTISLNDGNVAKNKVIGCKHSKVKFIIKAIVSAFKFKPDIIICNHVNLSPISLLLRIMLGIQYTVVTHGIEVWKLKKIHYFSLKYSKYIIAVSNYTKNSLISQNLSKKTILLLHPTFEEDKFYIGNTKNSFREKLGIAKSTKVIFSLCRLSKSEKYKGYDKIIQCLPNILKKEEDIKYIIGGSGDDTARIKDLVTSLNLEKFVFFAGYISDDEIVHYYNVCDLFILPSRGEGFGIVFIEALSCGKTVIAGNKDGSVDAVLNGELGLLVDPENQQDIENNIYNVLTGNIEDKYKKPDALRKKTIEAYGYNSFKKRLLNIINSSK